MSAGRWYQVPNYHVEQFGSLCKMTIVIITDMPRCWAVGRVGPPDSDPTWEIYDYWDSHFTA